MTGDGVKAEHERLRQMAGELQTSTSGLDSAARSVPPTPEVTISSRNVGHTLSEITKAAAAVAAGAEDISSKIHASDGSYAETDNRNAEDLNAQVPKFTR